VADWHSVGRRVAGTRALSLDLLNVTVLQTETSSRLLNYSYRMADDGVGVTVMSNSAPGSGCDGVGSRRD
jgi:hypothetical protein